MKKKEKDPSELYRITFTFTYTIRFFGGELLYACLDEEAH